MNKLLYALTAGATALLLSSGFAGAADPDRSNEARSNNPNRPSQEAPPRSSENQAGEPGVVETAPGQANLEKDYLAALKRCDSMTGGDKQQCVEAAHRKFGRM